MPRIRCHCLIAVGLLAGPASADPLAVETHGTLPFTDGELESALAVRAAVATPDNARSITATVTNEGSVIRVAVLGRDRTLTVEGQHGVDAARLVAFVVLDLAGDQLDPPDAPRHISAPPMPRVPESELRHTAPRIETPPVDHEPRATLGVWGRGGTRVEGELELALAVVGPVRATISGGASTQTTSQSATAVVAAASVVRRSYPVRAGLAWRGPAIWIGQLDVRATALALVETASAVVSRTDAIYGGGVALGWATPLVALDHARGATLTLGAGVDGFATANDYRVSAMPVVTTPRVAWWAGVGIAAELWR